MEEQYPKYPNKAKTYSKMSQEFRKYWKNYVFQSLFATIVLGIIMYVMTLQNAVIVASLGSTSFVIFAMPKSISARPRNVIGGNIACLIIGSLCHLIPHTPSYLGAIIIYSLSVGLSIFFMVVLDIEHPPAAGLALGLAIGGFSIGIGITILTAIIVLSIVHVTCKSLIRDLV